MTLTFKESRIVQDGGVWLCFKVLEPAPARAFVLGQKRKRYQVEVKEYRGKRSRDANSYCWALLDRLAVAVGDTKEELYRDAIKEIGVFKDFCLSPDEARTFQAAWSKLGTGWVTEQVDYAPDGERLMIRAYYGSSTYNTKQMSRLIDNVVQDCKAVGLETLPPEKLELLKSGWGNA